MAFNERTGGQRLIKSSNHVCGAVTMKFAALLLAAFLGSAVALVPTSTRRWTNRAMTMTSEVRWWTQHACRAATSCDPAIQLATDAVPPIEEFHLPPPHTKFQT